MRTESLLATLLLLALTPRAQDPEKTPVQTARPVVVTATRLDEDPFELPHSTAVFDSGLIRTERQSRTTPEVLRMVPGISVQKTAHGQGSPKFRGQTGFHTLLLVDGIRINDSTWRSGNVEYWNHLDQYSFDRFEVVRGPGAVLWGSDAVSGLGHAFSIGRDSFAPGTHTESRSLLRYASAENSFVGRLENQGNVDDVGWHAGISYKDFDDLTAGRGVGLLADTGYEQFDYDVKLTWAPSERERLSLAVQQSFLDDVPRTHSTVFNFPWRGITPGSDLQREHDHRRWLSYLRYQAREAAWTDDLTVTLAYKNRYEREDRVRSSGNGVINALDVETLAVTAQLTNETGFGTLVYGADWYHDFVDSDSRTLDPAGNVTSTLDRGVVAGDADYDMVGLFVQDRLPLGEEVDGLLGLRWSYVNLSADDVAVPGVTAVDHTSDHWNALTGSARAIYRPSQTVRVFGGVSQAFRAPNLSDATRFDVARTNEVEVPATGLDPEDYTIFEVGVRHDDGQVRLSGTAYYNLVRDQILRFRTGAIAPGGEFEVSKGNVGDGWYAGFELEGAVGLGALGLEDLADWTVYGYYDYVDGGLDQVLSSGQTVRDRPPAMPPPSGLIGVRWDDPDDRAAVQAFVAMAYHVRPSRYTEADRANTSRIPPDGLPGWGAVGLQAWYVIDERWTASLLVENLNDVDHRVMDSGLQEPGTNVALTVQASF